MNQQHSNLVHPEETFKEEWILSQRWIHSGGLIINHCIAPPDEVNSPPITDHLMVVKLSNGTRQINSFNEQEYDGVIHKGEFFLQPANLPAFFSWETTDRALLFIIPPSFLTRIALETECINPDRIEVIPILKSHDPQIENLADSFLQEIETGGMGSKIYTDSLANILAINLLRQHCTFVPRIKEISGGLSPSKLRQVIDYIHDHLSTELELKQLSKLIGLSPYYFIRKFKLSMGLTPHKYIMQQRIETAKRLLKQKPNVPLARVAVDCGFGNQSHFGHVFKKYVGVTPKAYREGL